MTDTPVNAPGWLRAVGGFGLIWNLYGVYKFFAAIGLLGTAPAAMPNWVVAAFGLGSLAGALGGLCLLLLSRWATPLLVVALVADLAWDARVLAGGDHASPVWLVASVTIVGIALAWVSVSAGKKGRLR